MAALKETSGKAKRGHGTQEGEVLFEFKTEFAQNGGYEIFMLLMLLADTGCFECFCTGHYIKAKFYSFQ